MKAKEVYLIDILVIVFISALVCSCGSATGNNDSKDSGVPTNGEAVISFNTTEHDIGRIGEGQKLAYSFIFTNNGTGSLVINSVTSSCGCTVPKYSNHPVEPGKKGTLEVVFDSSGLNGFQSKSITVQTNSTTPYVQLTVKAEVLRRER